MRPTWRTGGAIAALAIGCVLVTGCGGAGQAPVAADMSLPPASPGPAAAATRQLPIDMYQLTPAQLGEENYVQLRLEQACMRRFGFRFMPAFTASLIGRTVGSFRVADSRLWGVSDMAAARSWGYHLPLVPGTPKPVSIARLPVAERVVFLGPGPVGPAAARAGLAAGGSYAGHKIPTGGCLGQADNQLQEDGVNLPANVAGPTGLVNAISARSWAQTRSDPRMARAEAQWSACMRAHGYRYRTSLAAGASPRWMTGPVTTAEIRTAVTDVRCKQQTNLLGAAFLIQWQYQATAIRKDALALANVRAALHAQQRALARLMATLAARSHSKIIS